MKAATEPHHSSGLPMAIMPRTPCRTSAQRYQMGVASKIQVSGREAMLCEPWTFQLKLAM